ncbi:MAG: DUF4114 domain-containing protein [Caldilinea sp.]|nr:DUF4114 domain-containing protein [Caldilinea sp.]
MKIYVRCLAITAALVLFLMIPSYVHADPLLPLPRIPIGGDQDDPLDPPRLNDPDFTHIPDVQLFTVPGEGATELTFDFVYRAAAMNSEFGYFRVDDPSGAINGMAPGAPGYLAAALARAVAIFESGADASAPDVHVSLAGRDHLAFFIVQDATLAALKANNPQNLRDRSPRAYFSLDILNPDGMDHFIGFRNRIAGITQFGFEDMDGGGDQDFDDIVYNINAYLQPLPSPAARNIVFVRSMDSLGDCNGADQWMEDYIRSSDFQQSFGSVLVGALMHFNYGDGGMYVCPTAAPAYAPEDTCDGIVKTADELKAAISEHAGGKTSIIAHGTGGLVAAYLVGKQQEWAKANVASVVAFDSPLQGITQPQSWAQALGSVCAEQGIAHSGGSTLADLQDTGEVALAARVAAAVVPFYVMDATAEDAPQFETVPRVRARLSNSRPFSSAALCGGVDAPDEPLCEPPLPIADDHTSIWLRRYDGRGLDKAYLAACGMLNRTDCRSSSIPVPPPDIPAAEIRIVTSTVTLDPGIVRIRFVAAFTGSVSMRLTASDGTIYGPGGEGPIAGYSRFDSGEVYELVNPVPGEWLVEFMIFGGSGGENEIVLTVSIIEFAESAHKLAPIAVLAHDISGYAFQYVVLSGVDSVDHDGAIVTYEWDVDGDGFFDYTTTAPKVLHRYERAYSGEVLLRVTDNDGLSSQDTAFALIEQPRLFLPAINH